MAEKLISFLPDQFPNPSVFFVELTGITYPDPKYHVERDHSHVLCLEYVIRGKGVLRTGEGDLTVQGGDAYLLPMGENHRYRADPEEPWEKIWMNLRGSLCGQLLAAYGLVQTRRVRGCPLLPLFRRFVETCAAPPASPFLLESRCALLFHEILAGLRNHLAAAGPPSFSGPVDRAKEFLDHSLYRRVSIGELAGHACLSPSQLTRSFRRAFGQTPYDYLLSRRIDTACLLLRGTSMPVKEIAYRLCFSDEHYFSSLFRRKKGCTPRDFRAAREK